MARLKLCDGLFAEVVPVPLCAPAGTLRRGHVSTRGRGGFVMPISLPISSRMPPGKNS